MERERLQKLDVSWGHEPVSPLPALSPQGGERVAAGRERGWFRQSENHSPRQGDTDTGGSSAGLHSARRESGDCNRSGPLSRTGWQLFPLPVGEGQGEGGAYVFIKGPV